MTSFDRKVMEELVNSCIYEIDNAFKYSKSVCKKVTEAVSISGITVFGLFIGFCQFIAFVSQFIANYSLDFWIWSMNKLGRKRVILDRDQNEPYLERYYMLFRERNVQLPFNIFIHKILKSDRDMHDHPWGYRTLILSGGYWEHEFITERGTDTYRTWRGPGYTEVYDAYHSHKIMLEDGIPCWTIFIPFKQEKPWGFWRITKKETSKPTTRSQAALKQLGREEKEEIVDYEKRWIKHDIFLKRDADDSETASNENKAEDYSDEDSVEHNAEERDKKEK